MDVYRATFVRRSVGTINCSGPLSLALGARTRESGRDVPRPYQAAIALKRAVCGGLSTTRPSRGSSSVYPTPSFASLRFPFRCIDIADPRAIGHHGGFSTCRAAVICPDYIFYLSICAAISHLVVVLLEHDDVVLHRVACKVRMGGVGVSAAAESIASLATASRTCPSTTPFSRPLLTLI